jgi:hypothetical protein
MAYQVHTATVDEATKLDHLDEVGDSTEALKEARRHLVLGGDYEAVVSDTSFVPLPGYVAVRIDDTNLGGLTVEYEYMCYVQAGTGTVRLYNMTDTAEVAGSQDTFTNTTIQRQAQTVTLVSGEKLYRLEVKGAAAADLPCVWGAHLVTR